MFNQGFWTSFPFFFCAFTRIKLCFFLGRYPCRMEILHYFSPFFFSLSLRARKPHSAGEKIYYSFTTLTVRFYSVRETVQSLYFLFLFFNIIENFIGPATELQENLFCFFRSFSCCFRKWFMLNRIAKEYVWCFKAEVIQNL